MNPGQFLNVSVSESIPPVASDITDSNICLRFCVV